eukprot:10584213-Lingulodinium_polyedra.AAC.1
MPGSEGRSWAAAACPARGPQAPPRRRACSCLCSARQRGGERGTRSRAASRSQAPAAPPSRA